MKQKHFITQKIILVFAIQFYNQIYICFFPIHIDPNISFDIGSSVLALEQEETMYVNNKIYKNTLSTYTRKKENAYNIAAKAWNKKNFCTPNAISDKPHSEFGTRFWHYHPGDKMSRLSSHSFYNNPIF